MRTIVIFTRAYKDDEFDQFWSNNSILIPVFFEDKIALIATYEKSDKLIILIRSCTEEIETGKKILSELDRIIKGEILILHHSTENTMYDKWVQNYKNHFSYSSLSNFPIWANFMNPLENDTPLTQLRNSLQLNSANVFQTSFDKVWEIGVKKERTLKDLTIKDAIVELGIMLLPNNKTKEIDKFFEKVPFFETFEIESIGIKK